MNNKFRLLWLLFILYPFQIHCDSNEQSLVKPAKREPSDVKRTASSIPSDEPLIGPTAELHSSFSDEMNTGSHQLDVDPTVLNHVNVDAELSETVQDIALTLSDVAAGLDTAANATTDDRYVVRAQPREPGDAVRFPVEEIAEPVPSDNATGEAAPVRVAPDDIPSFSEWTQKQLAERRRADPNVTERVRNSKVRSKNFGSPDCGAKIVAANPEAVSAASVLSSSRDEYMLNHCTARIWFIVELCEAIQAKQLDLANFELFSSSPKEFSVSIGTRFPSRDWRGVGRFTALDSRDIQTFQLSPYLFGKYLKIEVHSHYGKEHYCPLSWVRVFGTSEYEVLATEDDRDDDDDVAEEEEGDAPKNLFSSATDAVLSIVKKATAPFMKKEEDKEFAKTAPSLCISPRYLTVCNNCSEHIYDNLFYLLSCQTKDLYELVATRFIRKTLIQTDACNKYGLDFVSLREGAPYPQTREQSGEKYITALFKEPYFVALCNVLAVLENRVLVNMSVATSLGNLTEAAPPSPSTALHSHSSTCDATGFATSTPISSQQYHSPSSIQPTKTLRDDQVKNLPAVDAVSLEFVTDSNRAPSSTTTTATTTTTASTSSSTSTLSEKKSSSSTVDNFNNNNVPKVSFVEKGLDEVETREPDASLDAILQDLSELERVVNDQPTSSTPPPSPPKDSIFLRLANRIKNLELNMSLSSSYLEELSRRYRVQLEVLGQTGNATAMRLDEQIRLEELRSKRREEEMSALRAQLAITTKNLAILMSERNSWFPRLFHVFWFFAGVLFTWYIGSKYVMPTPLKESPRKRNPYPKGGGHRRRNSVGSVPELEVPARQMQRRPSDEALEITLGTNFFDFSRKRKKKRKDNSRRTSVVAEKRKKPDVANSVPDYERTDNETVPRQASEPPISTCSTSPILFPASFAEVETSNRFAAFASPEQHPVLTRRFSSPAFMRTAMSSRSGRTCEPGIAETNSRVKKESGFKKYMRKLF